MPHFIRTRLFEKAPFFVLIDRTTGGAKLKKASNINGFRIKDNSVRSEGSTSCASVQQEIIFANFQACIQAFMPGYRLFFTLLLGESLGGIQKTNIKPNTEPFPNCCFSHDKGVLGSNSRDAFCLKNLS